MRANDAHVLSRLHDGSNSAGAMCCATVRPHAEKLDDTSTLSLYLSLGASSRLVLGLEADPEVMMARTGLIDHIGIGVPELAAAKRYYDELMPVLGLKQWFKTTEDGSFNFGPDGARGPQLFFYQALEPSAYSRHHTGLQHIGFMVATRAIVREAHEWAVAHAAEIVHEPREFPEYGEHYATYWLDPHGFMLEAVCHSPEESS